MGKSVGGNRHNLESLFLCKRRSLFPGIMQKLNVFGWVKLQLQRGSLTSSFKVLAVCLLQHEVYMGNAQADFCTLLFLGRMLIIAKGFEQDSTSITGSLCSACNFMLVLKFLLVEVITWRCG